MISKKGRIMFTSLSALGIVALLCAFANATVFLFQNNLNKTVWMGCLGNDGHAHLSNGGWKLGAGKTMSVEAPDNWAGRFWARTYCNSKTNICETGHCGKKIECNGTKSETAVTYAEFTLQGHAGLDYYDISLVDGFNVKMAITSRVGQPDGTKNYCARAGCDHDFNEDCPNELRQIDSNNKVIACKSACRAFGTDDYCCSHHFSRPSFSCIPTSWPKNYAKFFKDKCPDAYSYAHDHETTFHCVAPTYVITVG